MISFSNIAFGVFVPPDGGGSSPNPVKKYGFFIWASDINDQRHIDSYENTIRAKGYTTKDWPNPVTLATVFSEINNMEDYNDRVFIYITAHGDATNRDRFYHRGVANSVFYTTVQTLRYYVNTLDAQNIAILIDSCYSGAFYNEFKNTPGIMIMTSADTQHICWVWALGPLATQGVFSHHFFYFLGAWSSAWLAFNYAASLTIPCGPCCADNAAFDFF